MEAVIIAVGRARGGPEAALTADRLERFGRTGRALGLGPARLLEVESRKLRGAEAEGALVLGAVPQGAAFVVLDERGVTLDSPGLARRLADWRDEGRRATALAIGGADGHAEAVRARADLTLSFGPMVWPHMLARAMLAEQLYRAATILAGTPYHRA
ncbi:MAG: 23S rRNA (pseudouridine(1915)-N(3))-methyltransferase RlmH [Paracoccaceae bacterium]